ncbi:MAG: hypothetical protein MI867_18010 [Pseudomonadales bacterium]|nr:hypothetical protein [Pseudomonadales bacterium]
MSASRFAVIVCVVASAITVSLYFLYLPALSGFYILDDKASILDNPYLHITGLTVKDLMSSVEYKGPMGIWRPIAMMSFAINFYFTGLDPFYFKLTNLAIHLVNTFLVWWLGLQLYSAKFNSHSKLMILLVPAIGAFLWASHSLHVSAVMYVVQRMTLLSTLFALLFLNLHFRFMRDAQSSLPKVLIKWMIIFIVFCLGLLCKENMIVVVPLAYFVSRTIRCTKDEDHSPIVNHLHTSAFVIAPLLLFLAFMISKGFYVETFEDKPFTLLERLLTQTRIIVTYLGWILFPNALNYHFFYDVYEISSSLINPISTLWSFLLLLGLVVFCIAARKNLSIFVFAVGFFLIGHSLESTFLPLELVFEHRNYMPSIGIFIGLSLLLGALAGSPKTRIVGLLVVIFAGWNLVQLSLRASEWRSEDAFYQVAMAKNISSVRLNVNKAKISLGKLLSGEGDRQTHYLDYLESSFRAISLGSNDLSGYFALIAGHLQAGLPVKPKWEEGAVQAFAKHRFRIEYNRNLVAFLQCIDERRCADSNQFEYRLMDAVISNENNRAYVRSAVARNAAIHLIKFGHLERAIRYYELALALDSNIRSRGELSALYLISSKPQDARKQYQLGLDEFGVPFVEDYGVLASLIEVCCKDVPEIQFVY